MSLSNFDLNRTVVSLGGVDEKRFDTLPETDRNGVAFSSVNSSKSKINISETKTEIVKAAN